MQNVNRWADLLVDISDRKLCDNEQIMRLSDRLECAHHLLYMRKL